MHVYLINLTLILPGKMTENTFTAMTWGIVTGEMIEPIVNLG
jgi:hypothetical protein